MESRNAIVRSVFASIGLWLMMAGCRTVRLESESAQLQAHLSHDSSYYHTRVSGTVEEEEITEISVFPTLLSEAVSDSVREYPAIIRRQRTRRTTRQTELRDSSCAEHRVGTIVQTEQEKRREKHPASIGWVPVLFFLGIVLGVAGYIRER
ncbi:hypothetical protein [Porphyromonas loveana]|uniref:Lipoprotein n=1 Tax=Porphyromonas loveana TaxID=1884669 RepID=A0A2U1FEX4_9PORP|nr:hypothetical protein [Porphyromonas loveana]PVZ10714.1 hypothetical protein C7382_10779 [Porphyromonas loveana]